MCQRVSSLVESFRRRIVSARLKTWIRRILVASAIAYPAVLLVVTLALRLIGERWWATGLLLFLPRAIFAAPFPFTLGALLFYKARRLLWTQAIAFRPRRFSVDGVRIALVQRSTSGEPVVRVLSYNVNSGYSGFEEIFAEIDSYSPDIVFLQELFVGSDQMADLLKTRYPVVQGSTQFLVASRFPILAASDPEKLEHEGRLRSPRFVQQIIDTPIGQVAFYNVHPVSPRVGFYKIRGGGLKREILSGRFFSGENAGAFNSDNELREEQVRAFGQLADEETYPVVIAGDTNMPGLSPLLSRYLRRYRDGFGEAGWGLGYTFPVARFTWMRLDRILASDELKFVGFEVGHSNLSDHRCVVADLQRRAK